MRSGKARAARRARTKRIGTGRRRKLAPAAQDDIAVPAKAKKSPAPRKKMSPPAEVNGSAEGKPASIRKRRPAGAAAER